MPNMESAKPPIASSSVVSGSWVVVMPAPSSGSPHLGRQMRPGDASSGGRPAAHLPANGRFRLVHAEEPGADGVAQVASERGIGALDPVDARLDPRGDG